MRKLATRRIVWAIDPFCEENSLVKQTARALRLLASRWDAEVEPVYLLGGFPPNVKLLPALIRDIQERSEEELRHLIKGIAIPRLKPIRVVENASSQLREEVDQLIAYAKKSQANMIAVATRARKGPKRWFVGSFAETLVLRSDVPLFVINPNEVTPKGFKHILFPTDFSDESKAALEHVIQFAKEIGASITLFHKIKYDLTPAVEVAFSAYPPYKDVFQEEVQARQHDADVWAKKARSHGVEAESLIDYRMQGPVVQAILRRSKSRGGIIAMAAHSGPLASALLGSVTRQVVRSAVCPVWVIHTEQRKKGRLPFKVTQEDVISDLTEHGRGVKRA